MQQAGPYRRLLSPSGAISKNRHAPFSSCSRHCRSPWDFEHRLDLILVSLDRPMTFGALCGSSNGGCKLLREASQHLDAAMLLYLQTLVCVRLVFYFGPHFFMKFMHSLSSFCPLFLCFTRSLLLFHPLFRCFTRSLSLFYPLF